MFHKLHDTKNHIDHTTVEGAVIQSTSVRANNVLHKAEEIYHNVDANLQASVFTFKRNVERRKSSIPPPFFIEDRGMQTDPISFATTAVTTKDHCAEIAVQTEAVTVKRIDESGGVVSRMVSEYEKLKP